MRQLPTILLKMTEFLEILRRGKKLFLIHTSNVRLPGHQTPPTLGRAAGLRGAPVSAPLLRAPTEGALRGVTAP